MKKIPSKKKSAKTEESIFRFEVAIISGPMTEEFIRKNPKAPTRIIEMLGSHTLQAFHEAIFFAFDREDAHLYEFQIGGRKPMASKATCYNLGSNGDFLPLFGAATHKEKMATQTTIESLQLALNKTFFYWFDFGDDWWHAIKLIDIRQQQVNKTDFPILVAKIGESPPQYADFDDEDDLSDDFIGDFFGDFIAEGPFARGKVQKTDEKDVIENVRYREIALLLEKFTKAHLTADYLVVAQKILQDIFATDLPINRSKAESWAAGILHAAGLVNFLADPTTEPYLAPGDIAKHLGVSPGTMGNKSRDIREELDIVVFDPEYCIPDILKKSPFTWMVMVDGFICDIRQQPRAEQEKALKKGLIPFLPE